jgi:predicted amidohydrolase YtcJ
MTIEEVLRIRRGPHEENVKGSVSEGKLADLVVLSKDIRRAKREELLQTTVVYTPVGGAVVYKAE